MTTYLSMARVPFARLGPHTVSTLLAFVSVIATLLSCVPKVTVIQPISMNHTPLLDSLADMTVILLNDSTCAGVWVGEHEFITASHCVDTPEWCTVNDGIDIDLCRESPVEAQQVFFFKTHDDIVYGTGSYMVGRHPAVLIRVSKRADLALLRTNIRAPGVARLGADEPEPDTEVHVVGHPDAVPYMYATVTIKRHTWERVTQNKTLFDRRLTVVDYVAAGGTSGGGIWTDQGELVGICLSRSIWKILNESYFASVQEIKAIMDVRGPMSSR